MNTDDKPCQATPFADLRQQIMDSRVPKNECEWWASRMITKLETELAAAQSERDLAITRVASILWSGAIDKHTCGDVQQWVTDYTAELAAAKSECERLQFKLVEWEAQERGWNKAVEADAAELARLRAEVERLKDHAFDADGTPWKTVCGWWAKKYDAVENSKAISIARAERAEAEVERLKDNAFHAAMKGTT